MVNLNEYELDFLMLILKNHIEQESHNDVDEMTFLIEMYEKLRDKHSEITTIEKDEKNKAKLN
tara:strand:+ start:419 stop:607 length:189 start_codon:yes stop_codon:yes gene_type:complete